MAEPAIYLELKTVDDYLALPDDGHRYELIAGEIVMSPSPTTKHQRVIARLTTRLHAFVESRRLGEVFFAPLDVQISRYSVVQPDVTVVLAGRSAIVSDDRINGAPDLVVEVISPSSRKRDLRDKANLYMHAGVPEYWIVDPESEAITVYVLSGGGYLPSVSAGGVARSQVLPGFEVVVAEIFAAAGDLAG